MKLIENIDFLNHDIKWLYSMNKDGILKVDNSFQRNYVWINKNKIKLLETILLGFSIPEIYLWNIGTDPDTGNTEYSIIDGQQRSGAIISFINGDFKLSENYLDKKSNIFNFIKNKHFAQLDNVFKQAIWSYKFSFKIVRAQIKKEDIVQMFLRLNSNNYTLNPQELRRAEFDGEFLKLSEKIAAFDFWKEHNYFSSSDIRRMKDISFISSLLIFLRFGIEGEITSTGINKAYEYYNENYPQKDEDENIFSTILQQINKIIDGDDNRLNFLKRTVHFYTLFTALYPIVKEHSNTQSHHIKNYQKFIDLYDNEPDMKKFFGDILYKEIEQYKLKTQEGTAQRANRVHRFTVIQKILRFVK